MRRLTRRSFLASSAVAVAARPAFGAPRPAPVPEVPRSGWVDAVVVGAGAAGIAAGRRLAAAGKRFVVLEAADEVGGRCITDTKTFGVPYDRGAHWIFAADINPLGKLAMQVGLDVYPAPPGQRMRIGRRYAREGEMEDFLASLVRANTAIADVARKSDVACTQALPKELGDWRTTIEFVLGPYGCSKDLSEVSTADLSHSGERDNNAFCRQGFGTLLARLAAPLPLLLSTPVKTIEWWSRARIEVDTTKGQFKTGLLILTVSTNVLTSGKIKLAPDLPKRHLEAATKLKLGSRDHIALELTGNPLGLRSDELVFEKAGGRQTAAIFGNMSGSTICVLDVGGNFGRDLSAKGEAAMIDFAISWLGGLYGADIKNAVKRRHATRWNNEPWVLGAASAAAPGAQSARKVLAEPINYRIFLAGEATHETRWGTVNGAWESGERAADAVVKLLGGPSKRM
ncbi:MAG TPA: FAD-dependent oxidoreductase [Xanthobacteraceae bacterium]|nr:FAD-dependent oxidoreductase [Xanthobacteraceae bacterium]